MICTAKKIFFKFELVDLGNCSTVSNEFVTKPDVLVQNLSFSHIREIMVLSDAFERFFRETECMKCNWTVRELRRQIKTNLYVRARISKKPELLIQSTINNNKNTMLTIKEPFTFEFLGLEAKDAVTESDLGQLNAYVGYYKKNEMIKKLNRDHGITIVMVLHDINQSLYYSDEIVAMKDGKIIAQGLPEEIISTELVKEVYGVELQIQSVDGKPFVIPV